MSSADSTVERGKKEVIFLVRGRRGAVSVMLARMSRLFREATSSSMGDSDFGTPPAQPLWQSHPRSVAQRRGSPPAGRSGPFHCDRGGARGSNLLMSLIAASSSGVSPTC